MKLSRTLATRRLGSIALGLSIAAGACTLDSTGELEPEVIAEDIEQEEGALLMGDEEPMFGEADVFEDLGLNDIETDIVDDYADDAVVREVMDAADVQKNLILVAWGDGDRPRRWPVTIRVDSGIILGQRAVRFEGDDSLKRRDDRQSISAETTTLKHFDGVILLVAAKAADAPGRTLSFEVDGRTIDMSLDGLLEDGPLSFDVGDAGDRVIAMARQPRLDTCEHGTMRGQWLQQGRGYGVLRARVSNGEGQPTGHLRGVYGVRRNGERVFFGKYISRSGQFKGIFGGHYRDGKFAGRWLTRAGEHGVLGGVYRETLEGRRNGGGFIGRWAETSCDSRIKADL